MTWVGGSSTGRDCKKGCVDATRPSTQEKSEGPPHPFCFDEKSTQRCRNALYSYRVKTQAAGQQNSAKKGAGSTEAPDSRSKPSFATCPLLPGRKGPLYPGLGVDQHQPHLKGFKQRHPPPPRRSEVPRGSVDQGITCKKMKMLSTDHSEPCTGFTRPEMKDILTGNPLCACSAGSSW